MAKTEKRLHLGCGEHYLHGYINIDYPLTEHSVQTATVADETADILKLRYTKASIDEVRLHHVFEHFSRATSVALLCGWRAWLKPNGTVQIEVPDFSGTARVFLNPIKTDRQRKVAERHIFGSQEAVWAVHFRGYTKKNLSELMKTFGFTVKSLKRIHWKGTYNLRVIAERTDQKITKKDATLLAKAYLGSFLLDSSPSEQRLLDAWMKEFEHQLTTTWPHDSK